ncbi:MAG: hypothetical protein ACRYFS_25360 [Janthinobacterium lividum]
MTNTPVSPPVSGRNPVLTALLALVAYSAFNLLLPLVPRPYHALIIFVFGIVVLSTAAFMLLQLWLAQAVVALKPRPLVSTGLAVLCAALFALFYLVSAPYGPNPPLLLQFGQGLAVTLGCTFFGILLSPIIREPNVLLPVALVAMPIDYLGAMTSIGFTQNMVANHPGIVRGVSVPVPSVGGSAHHGGLHPIGFIGPGDILFVAFFFAVVLRLNLNVRGTFWWIYGLLTLTMLTVLVTGINIAALVPMGLAVLIANFRSFKLKREEVFATIYAALFILVLITSFYFYAHSRFSHSDAQGDIHAPRSAPNRNPAPSRPAGN